MMVQEKLGRVVPWPVLETRRSDRLLPVCWNFSTSPELKAVIKLAEMETVRLAVLAEALVWLPAISVPAGFTDDGLPIGIQIVGRHQDDWGVLQLAHAFECARAVLPTWRP